MNVLLLNQCFYPDVASSGQHLTDLAIALGERGHNVTVLASRRGYDDPTVRFPRREWTKGVKVIRIPSSGLGKGNKWRRAVDFASFLLNASVRLALLPRFDTVLAMTSPPMLSFLAGLFTSAKGGRLLLWIMDMNPDEAVAANWLKERSLATRLLGAMHLKSVRQAESVLVLDRFMKQRLSAKGIEPAKITAIPPWSHDDAVRYDDAGRATFRARHGLSDKFVVMYSGNHSPCHPLDTILEAARRLADRPEIAFCFVGGGSELGKVKAFASHHSLTNILCLPYQPMEHLSASLSAADLHAVVMGNAFPGIIHPCKVYNILAIGAPFLYVGPDESHIGDILAEGGIRGGAYAARHGEIDTVTEHILSVARSAGGYRSNGHVAARFSKAVVLPQMIAAMGL